MNAPSVTPIPIITPDVQKTPAVLTPLVMLLGRRDVPTDGVEDYCRFLTPAMVERGYKVEIVQLAWDEVGWFETLRRLWGKSGSWAGVSVLVQYTALAWSRHGLPLGLVPVLWMLKRHGARLTMVYHDVNPHSGKRTIDRIRGACQTWVMRRAYAWARACIFPVPRVHVGWLPEPITKARFVPVGPNIPVILAIDRSARIGNQAKTIAVFGVTDGGDISREVEAIAGAAMAAAGSFREVSLVTMGRGSRESEADFERALAGSAVEFRALGVLPAEYVSRALSSCDLAIFVRGCISTQRGSAIASIACGVPLVAYGGDDVPGVLREAGVALVPEGDRQALANAVVRVLSDGPLWRELHNRNLRAHARTFSWEAIAEKIQTVLNHA